MQPIDYTSTMLVNDAYRNRNVISYEDLINKPQIQSKKLEGNKTFEDLDLSKINIDDLENIISSQD